MVRDTGRNSKPAKSLPLPQRLKRAKARSATKAAAPAARPAPIVRGILLRRCFLASCPRCSRRVIPPGKSYLSGGFSMFCVARHHPQAAPPKVHTATMIKTSMSYFSKSRRTTLQALHARKRPRDTNQSRNFILGALRVSNRTERFRQPIVAQNSDETFTVSSAFYRHTEGDKSCERSALSSSSRVSP